MSSLRDDVLARTDIVDLVSKYVDIKKKGKNRMGLCPFHKEKSPSFTVAEDKQIYKCFGCGKGGNAFSFHMEIERIDFWDSLQMLAKNANIDVSSYSKDPEKQAIAKTEREKQKLMNKRVAWFFQQQFSGSKAQEYVKEKRKLSEETIKTFGLGYAPNSYDLMMTMLKDKGFSEQDIIDAGLAKAGKSGGSAYAFFRHRLTFPIHDHVGNTVGFWARALDEDQNPKYLNTTETAVYNKSQVLYGLDKAKEHLSSFEQLIIVEGYMDVVALHQYGLPIGLATCGTALTTQHTKLINRYTPNLLFAFDNDNAWFEATVRGLKVAYEQDLFPKILVFPSEYKDVDQRLNEREAPVSVEDGIEQRKKQLKELSVDGFAWVLDQNIERYDVMNPVERKKVIVNCFELISKIEDYAIMQLYFSQLSTSMEVHEEQLWKQFRQWLKKSTVRTRKFVPEDEEKRPESSSKISEKYLLGSLLWKDFAKKLGVEESMMEKYTDLYSGLAKHFPTTILAEVYAWELSPSTKERLIEAELFREAQVSDLDQSKVSAVVQTFLHQQAHKLQRVVMKSKTLGHEAKQELLSKIRGL